MRHRKKGRKLGRTRSHRIATLRALATSLLKHKKITTTVAKAKALRSFVEPLITKAKENTVAARRYVARHIHDKEVVKELFGEIVDTVANRNGGYTRVVKLGQRVGDAAEMAIIELVDYNQGEEEKPKKTKKKAKKVEEEKIETFQEETEEATTEEVEATEEKAEDEKEAEKEVKEEDAEAKAEEKEENQAEEEKAETKEESSDEEKKEEK